MAKLLIQESNGAREFELVDVEITIGRELDNSLRLSDPSISRHHATLTRTPEGYEIHDQGSSNGVLLNGVKVGAGSLKDGDRITLGQMQLTFVDPPAAAPALNPLGTVRMSLEDMARIQAGATSETEVGVVPPPAVAPPPAAPLPAAMPLPEPPAEASAGAPPAFLQGYLPPVPDDAKPLILGGAIERGDFGARLGAWIIDAGVGLLLLVIFWVVMAVLVTFTHGLPAAVGCVFYLTGSVAYTLFMMWCQVAFRATVGKKAMRLRVVPELNPMDHITWNQALLRLLGHVVSPMLACLPYLLILGSERKGFQDLFSGSVVIKVDR
jgi:uncharacterized RDD family membrane protein YckC